MEALTPSVILLCDPKPVAVTMQRSRINGVRVPKRRSLGVSFLATLEELEKPLVHSFRPKKKKQKNIPNIRNSLINTGKGLIPKLCVLILTN